MFKTFTTDFGENNFLLIVPIFLCFQIEKFLLTKLARASFGIDDVTFVKQKHLITYDLKMIDFKNMNKE